MTKTLNASMTEIPCFQGIDLFQKKTWDVCSHFGFRISRFGRWLNGTFRSSTSSSAKFNTRTFAGASRSIPPPRHAIRPVCPQKVFAHEAHCVNEE